ncbi:hypothetical protein L873DRAFT_1813822 [Choiromyces venosus 120613-1]|uniref:Uncharacterized protein n=1 Tax=Choiromyces venosus 120613-1 TaxID=1336337 RepID=A0A3N4JCT4_9PEZI|nr:hypothetical protein L873DRAFT_1813822 [Choiromyces venosus 120613-1]
MLSMESARRSNAGDKEWGDGKFREPASVIALFLPVFSSCALVWYHIFHHKLRNEYDGG